MEQLQLKMADLTPAEINKNVPPPAVTASVHRPFDERSILLYRRPRKVLMAIRIDADVLDWFRSSGRGYQTRMNEALRRAMLDELRYEAGLSQ
jgi:uncharacterized protein (DUF4415 family)